MYVVLFIYFPFGLFFIFPWNSKHYPSVELARWPTRGTAVWFCFVEAVFNQKGTRIFKIK